ncbi:MAG: acetolactate decarboxylase [Streptococcaceae bacterium]|jgi:acetolactate decarboxylase|nr:acetolactate decarboxylase [Streptococcaceae bacterium]
MTALFQFNTLASLMSGFYDGQITVADIKKRGDFGIGSFDQVNGEMIVLDGVVYQAKGEGGIQVTVAEPNQTAPYVAVNKQQTDVQFEIIESHESDEVEQMIEAHLTSRNLFHSVKIHGNFSRLKIRMATKTPSGIGFDVVSAHQAEYELTNLAGTIVGFWTPSLFHGVSLGGFHLHFISDDKTIGGHVYDFSLEEASVELGQIDKIEQKFPIHDQSFLQNEIDKQKVFGIIDVSE